MLQGLALAALLIHPEIEAIAARMAAARIVGE